MKAFLTEAMARQRAASVLTGVKYDLLLDLNKGQTYSGLCHYDFKIASKDTVFLDFTGKRVQTLNLNNNHFTQNDINSIWQNGFLSLPKSELLAAGNKLQIQFENEYNNDGNGLHSFVDTDGNQYIYNQSEPYWANRIFPLFDQPDIKGRLTLRTLVPSDWAIIGNSVVLKEGSVEKFILSDLQSEADKNVAAHISKSISQYQNKRYVSFGETQLLPTYLYGFAAGPFAKISEHHKLTLPGVDMTIYCRESLVKFANDQQAQLFRFGSEATKFYNNFFQVEYPFQKFDYVFCPEFTVGAMEYPGIVTYNDRYLFRENPTAVQVTHRGETIVHELAHMWFGNLVTMKWWNDLWLNEAFASWVSYLANHHIRANLPFPTIDSWSSFQLQKFRAYNEDQEPTTHPIACEVASTDKADSIFDAITYCKGASVLHQLYHLLGHDLFSNNIATYFKKHRWSNAALTDFIDAMSEGTENVGLPISLKEWNKMWIETAGLNMVRVCRNSMNVTPNGVEFDLKQMAVLPEHPLLRYHKMQVAFFNENGDKIEVIDVMLQNELRTKVVVPGMKSKPYAILPNYGDKAYIKVQFDNQSTKFFLENTSKIKDSQSQLLISRALFEMVRDAELEAEKFIDFVFSQVCKSVKTEDLLVFDGLVSMVHDCVFKYLPKSKRFQVSGKVFDAIYQEYQQVDSAEGKKLMLKKLISFAFQKPQVITLIHLMNDDLKSAKMLGIGDLWNIAIKAQGAEGIPDATRKEVLATVESIDKSDLMKYSKLFIESMRADKDKREAIWAEVVHPGSKISFGDLDYRLAGMFSLLVPDAAKDVFAERYFEVLPKVIKGHSKTYARTFLTSCLPDTDDCDGLIRRLSGVLGQVDEQNEYFRILLKKNIFALERRKRVLQKHK